METEQQRPEPQESSESSEPHAGSPPIEAADRQTVPHSGKPEEEAVASSPESPGDREGARPSEEQARSSGKNEEENKGATREQVGEASLPGRIPITENDRTWAMLAYIGQIVFPILMPIIVLLVEPNRHRSFQRYHALHALALGVVSAIYEVLLVSLVLFFFGSGILFCLGFLSLPLFFVPYVLVIWYGIQAYQGRWFEIPGITAFLRQQKLIE